MTFDLTTLDGVTFGANTFSVDASGNAGNQPGSLAGVPGHGFELEPTATAGTAHVAYVDGFYASASGWTVSTPTNHYVAGNAPYTYNGHTYFYLPTFGTIYLSGTSSSNYGHSGQYFARTWYVHGFANGALLLSTTQTLIVVNAGGTPISYDFATHSSVPLAILSNTDLGAGPTSAGYTTTTVDALGYPHGPTQGTPLADGNAHPLTFPLTFTNNGAYTAPCFVEGSKVATVRGEVAVEALEVGDEVLTLSGEPRPVIWIGSRRLTLTGHPRPHEVNPVRVRAGAFGEGRPTRDLRLSPGHAVFLDGVLVPVGQLVNGATIVQEEADRIRYFHVELDAHDVLLAEGLPCESYLDDGNREAFANSPEHLALYGRLDPVDWEGACAPVLRDWDRDHAALTAIRARLHARAEQMGWSVASAADPVLVADGVTIAPLHAAGSRLWFQAPAAGALALVSGAGRPFDLVPGHGDLRRLGVAISELRVDGHVLDLESDAFGEGFMELERRGGTTWRWTDGCGSLRLQGPALIEIDLHMTALCWIRPAGGLRLIHVH